MSVKFEFNNIDEQNVIEKVDLDADDQVDPKGASLFEGDGDDDDDDDDDDSKYHDYCEPYMLFELSEHNLKVLNDIIEDVDDDEWHEERYDWHDGQGNNYEDYRNVKIFSPCEDDDSDVFELIKNLFDHVNDDNFNYDMNEGCIDIQLLKYGVGGNYKWHCDYGLSKHSERGMTRKLSMSIQLSDENNYKGGQFELIDYSGRHQVLGSKKGAGVVFDSRLPHKANIVEKGERLVLVAWASGPQLR